MESLYSMSACGHLESSSSTHSPSYPCSWNTSPIPGRLDVSMTLDARFTVPFISGILLWNGGNISAGVYRFSTHMDISGPVNCGIIHIRTLYGVCWMEKGVKGSGVSYATLFLDYVLQVTTIVYLCLTCKLSISPQRNTSSYQGGSRNIFNMQRVSSALQPKINGSIVKFMSQMHSTLPLCLKTWMLHSMHY